MATKAIIDADPICYSVAFAAQDYALVDEDGNICNIYSTAREAKEAGVFPGDQVLPYPESLRSVENRVNDFMQGILDELDTTEYVAFLTNTALKDNFRHIVNPGYKSHRRDLIKPYHYQNIRDYLQSAWGCEMAYYGLEADDELAIVGWEAFDAADDSVVLCTIDKDLDTVPGWHYRWPTHNKEGAKYYLTADEAENNFWVQVLTGDTADNIIGLRGIGPKKAAQAVKDCATTEDYYAVCKRMYIEKMAEKLGSAEAAIAMMHMNCTMLHLLRHEEDMWEAPNEFNDTA